MKKYFNFWLSEAKLFKNATWKRYRDNLIKFNATSIDWQVGQLFLCSIHEAIKSKNLSDFYYEIPINLEKNFFIYRIAFEI